MLYDLNTELIYYKRADSLIHARVSLSTAAEWLQDPSWRMWWTAYKQSVEGQQRLGARMWMQ